VIPLSVADLAKAVGGTLAGADPDAMVTAPATIDSRTVTPGALFVALPGEHVDGHDFAAEAVEQSAAAALTARPVEGTPCIVVEDPQRALGLLARYVVDRLPELTIVGLTGSQGKTSTKDLIAQLLRGHGPTVAPKGSLNNEIGHPLTALQCDERTRFLVSEMGARHLGDIRYLTGITPPRIAVVLNVGLSHLGEFGDQDTIAVAKGELVEALPEDGVAVLNADDPRVTAMASKTPARILTFGESDEADVRATGITLDRHGRPAFTLQLGEEQQEVHLQLVGEHNVSNALAAAAVAHAVQLPPEQIAAGLNTAQAESKWRMEVTERTDGVTVINDAYNANPDSMRAALKALVAIGRARGPKTRTWAVLGEMRELGAASTREHDAVGRLAVRLDVNRLVAVGEAARPIHLGAAHEGSWGEESVYADSIGAALDLLRRELLPGDVVLVKASRAVGLEKLAAELTGEAAG
jgi:UDP-N-acetylmuramoyl-tripeptide--D-alanyl-D-alanine ligase